MDVEDKQNGTLLTGEAGRARASEAERQEAKVVGAGGATVTRGRLARQQLAVDAAVRPRAVTHVGGATVAAQPAALARRRVALVDLDVALPPWRVETESIAERRNGVGFAVYLII